MSATDWSLLRSYTAFVGLALLSAALICALGYVPTVRVSGPGAVVEMALGCAVSFVSSCVGAIPVVLALPGGPSKAPTAILGATALRFVVALVLVVPLALSGRVDRTPFVFWVGVSYVLMLAVDTVYAVSLVKRVKPEDS